VKTLAFKNVDYEVHLFQAGREQDIQRSSGGSKSRKAEDIKQTAVTLRAVDVTCLNKCELESLDAVEL
jgi:hypothetical protein